jgi:hypothetical protein
VNYARYVDDILLIYDSQHTDLQSILHNFNSLHQNLHFTGETEHNNAINYLDITIHKTPSNINISVYRKPHLQTPSFHTPPTIPHNIKLQQSVSYTTA